MRKVVAADDGTTARGAQEEEQEDEKVKDRADHVVCSFEGVCYHGLKHVKSDIMSASDVICTRAPKLLTLILYAHLSLSSTSSPLLGLSMISIKPSFAHGRLIISSVDTRNYIC